MKVTEKELYNYLIKKGLSRNHAIGMINNIKSESSFNVGVLGDFMIADPTGKLKNSEKLVFQGKDKSWYYTKYHPTKAREKVPSDLWSGIEAKSGGLFQHYGSRFEAMKKSAGSDWKTDWKGQIDYALKENDTKKYLAQNFPNEQEASTWFTVNWERPQNAIDTARTRLENIPTVIKNIDSPEEVKDDDVIVDGGELPEVTVEEQGTTVDAGELPEVTIKEQELIADGGTLPEVTIEEEGKTFDAGTLPEIKIESKLDLDSIRSLPPQALQVDSTGTLRGPKLSTAQTQENKSAAKTEVVETQYIQVMGPNGELVTIPVGKNVTKEDIQKSLESQQEGSGKRQEVTQQLEARDTMLDKDNDGIPDTIDVDGGTGTNVPQVNQEQAEESEKVEVPEIIQKPQDNAAENANTDEEGPNIMGVANALLRGTGAILDGLGGPGALISYVMGKKGLDAAMKEVQPQSKPELSPMFMQHLRQTRELAKRGFHPDQARELQLDDQEDKEQDS